MNSLIYLTIDFLYFVIVLLIVYFVLSFFPLKHGGFFSQLRGILASAFEPLLAFMRRYIPPIGPLDLSGLVLIFGIRLLQYLLFLLIS